jgi:hypothetical protein
MIINPSQKLKIINENEDFSVILAIGLPGKQWRFLSAQ